MFALVKFHNDEYYITRLTKIKIVQGDNICIVKYKGASYAATLIGTNSAKPKLEKLLKLERKLPIQNQKIERLTERCNASLIDETGYSEPLNALEESSPSTSTGTNKPEDKSKEQNVLLYSREVQSECVNVVQEPAEKSVGQNNEVNRLLIFYIEVQSGKENEGVSSSDINLEFIDDVQKSQEKSVGQNDEVNSSEVFIEYLNDCQEPEECETHNDTDPTYTPYCNNSAETSHNSRNKSMASSRYSNNLSYRTDISTAEPSLDIRKLTVPSSIHNDKKTSKKDFCIYCKTMVTQFARHLQSIKHRNEDEVKIFMKYPQKSLIRKRLINKLRRKGNFVHNTNPEYNTGILVTCRRKQAKSKNTAEDYIACTNCQGLFSMRTIRLHYKNCNNAHKKGVREITAMGRKMSNYIHARANDTLQKIIIPSMHDDDITRTVKYDELIIIAGNKFCEKYTQDQHVELIRGHLRLLGRLKLAVQKRNTKIQEFAEIFHPQHYDVVVEGVKEVARYDEKRRVYAAPSNATTLGTLIKKCSKMLIAECIKSQDSIKQKAVEDFMILYDDDFPNSINKKILEAQIRSKREKTDVLPTREDIKKLYTYLLKICKEATCSLEENFTYRAWKSLSEACLILLQMFNRRRSGEIERLNISDYNRQEAVDKNYNPELFSKLTDRAQEYANRYVRITICGKLNRTVPVLLDMSLVKFINLIIKHRIEAGVKPHNKYVFGVPQQNKMTKKYLRACPLMRKFSEECGAMMPESLRGTKLRKHIATYTAMLGIEENDVDELANFMGHNKQIHKEIYRIPIPFRDITNVSQLLLAAMGADEDDEDASDYSNDDEPNNFSIGKTQGTTDMISQKSNNDNDSDDQVSPKPPKQKRSTSPFGKTKRERWTDDEKAAVEEHFGFVANLKTLPTLEECSAVIKKYPTLSRRKPQTLKTWIDNQRKAPERKLARSQQNM